MEHFKVMFFLCLFKENIMKVNACVYLQSQSVMQKIACENCFISWLQNITFLHSPFFPFSSFKPIRFVLTLTKIGISPEYRSGRASLFSVMAVAFRILKSCHLGPEALEAFD